MNRTEDDRLGDPSLHKESLYMLELAGEDDAFAGREATAVASEVTPLAPGLALAGDINSADVRRLAYTRRASALLGRTDATVGSARHLVASASIDREGTVAVRARDVRGRTGVDTQRAERELGAVLVERGFDIDLDAPDHELRAVFAVPADPSLAEGTSSAGSEAEGKRGGATDAGGAVAREGEIGICALGWLAAESVRDFGGRAPTNKPFFQPGSMDPLFARAIANIAGAGSGKTIVDPMCGTGGLLVEGGLVGSRVVGIDAQAKMAEGARTNLAHYLGGNELAGSEPDEDGNENPSRNNGDSSGRGNRTDEIGRRKGEFVVLQGDATRLPLREGVADGVCFDVPYGRQSKIAGDLDSLVAGALVEARRLAPRAVIVGDRPWTEATRKAGWAIESSFERRVHRSLTRHVAVLEPAGSD